MNKLSAKGHWNIFIQVIHSRHKGLNRYSGYNLCRWFHVSTYLLWFALVFSLRANQAAVYTKTQSGKTFTKLLCVLNPKDFFLFSISFNQSRNFLKIFLPDGIQIFFNSSRQAFFPGFSCTVLFTFFILSSPQKRQPAPQAYRCQQIQSLVDFCWCFEFCLNLKTVSSKLKIKLSCDVMQTILTHFKLY